MEIIFCIIAFAMTCISLCVNNRKKSLFIQSFNCICEGIYDYLIYAYTGAILSLINLIRTFIFIKKDSLNKKIYNFLIILFFVIIIIGCIYTWNGYISLLPTIGSIIRLYCLSNDKMKLIRISGVTTGLLYGIYYIYYNSLLFVIGDSLILITSLISIYKYDIKGSARDKNN